MRAAAWLKMGCTARDLRPRAPQVNAGAKKFLASCGHERTASIWNLETEELERELYGHRAIVNDLSFDRCDRPATKAA